jgi:hypothetical protein
MQTITGHLTATEKKHIAHLLKENIMYGKIKRKSYFITSLGNNFYSVCISETITNWCETRPRLTTNMHTFKTQG